MSDIVTDGMTYPEFVALKKKPGQDIIDSLTPETADAWHMGSAIPSEAGELFDAVKKWVIYRKPLDRKNVVEELGDLEFYMEGLRQRVGITREETIGHNVGKLSGRYKKGYSDQEAQDRADKKNGE